MKGDDDVSHLDLIRTELGGHNTFNEATIGLFIGHGLAALQAEWDTGITVPQAYTPIYHQATNSWEWVRTSDSNWGSSNLKWMHLLTCNYFRDNQYRQDGIYSGLKNHGVLPMNTDLHVLSSFATQSTVHSGFGKIWTRALTGQGHDAPMTVIQAWAYAGGQTQPRRHNEPNVARSLYWFESFNDRIYGFGSQTSPSPNNTYADILEFDTIYTP